MTNNEREKLADERPLVVMHIAPTPFFADRGCHMRVRGLIHALNFKGVRNILCTYHHGRDIADIETVRTPTIRAYTQLEAGPSPYKYLADILLFLKVCGVIWKNQPDIIHGHLHEGSLIGWMARWVFFWRRIPLIFDVQGSLVGELDAHGYFDKYAFLRKFFWSAEWLITRMPQHFLCSSNRSLSILKDEFSIPSDKLTLISDGADVIEPDQDSIKALRLQLKFPQDKPIVIYTGALLEAKGLSDLCSLIEATAHDKLACHFLIVGYPVETLQGFLVEKKLEFWCTLVGRVKYEALSTYLLQAQVAIEPKAADSGEASGKLLNYAAASLPVVCYDTPNNQEILSGGGYYASKNDSHLTLLRCLKQALASPDEARLRGEKARLRLERQYSWRASAEKVYKIYQHSTFID